MRLLFFLLCSLTAHAQFGTPADLAFGGSASSLTDWASRVIANGGAQPSANSINAIDNFRVANSDLLTSFVAVCCFAPDSLIACTTPLVVGPGYPLWTNVNFSVTNLTVNGLTGDGSSKYLQTGVLGNATGLSVTSAGISLLMYANPDTAGNGLVAQQQDTVQFSMFSYAGTGLFRCWAFTGSANFATGSVGSTTNGWLSGNRTAANAITLYKARSDTTFAVVATETGTQSGSPTGTAPLTVFAMNCAGTPCAYSAPTISFVAITAGLTQAQSSNLYTRVVALRTALGGGNP